MVSGKGEATSGKSFGLDDCALSDRIESGQIAQLQSQCENPTYPVFMLSGI